MSELIIIGYDDHATARRAYEQVQDLQREYVVNLNGLALVTVDDEGKNHVDTPGKIVGVSAAAGALWGALLGILFLVPVFGMLIGGALGALFGKLDKSGINHEFRSRVQEMLGPGKAAVVIMASKITEDKFASAMQPYGGQLLQTSLSEEDEAELAAELGGRSSETPPASA
jgi:uncharacterized membrane protein